MNPKIEVMKQLLDLTDTIEEGIIFINEKLAETDYAPAIQVTEDVIGGYASCENAVNDLLLFFEDEQVILSKQTDLRDVMARLVSAYEQEDYVEAQKIVESSLVITFNAFKKSITEELKAYVHH